MKDIIKNCPDDKFIEIFNKCQSINQIIVYFKLNVCGAQYDNVKEKIKSLGLNTDEFKKVKMSKLHRFNTIPTESILVENSTYLDTHKLKKRLVKEGVIEYKCNLCDLNNWQGKYISLHLDHINGDRYDNRIENLRILCPNCHSQSETYAGKNKRKKIEIL